MEGVAAESASLAGHLKLGNLIYLYDDNKITIDGLTDLAFTEDVPKRFESCGWHTSIVEDGNDLDAIEAAIRDAQVSRRSAVADSVKTTIGFGMPTAGHAQSAQRSRRAKTRCVKRNGISAGRKTNSSSSRKRPGAFRRSRRSRRAARK